MGEGLSIRGYTLMEVTHNPDELISALSKLEAGKLEDYGRLLYEQAVIAEGSKVKDPLAFARRINDLLVKDPKL